MTKKAHDISLDIWERKYKYQGNGSVPVDNSVEEMTKTKEFVTLLEFPLPSYAEILEEGGLTAVKVLASGTSNISSSLVVGRHMSRRSTALTW